MGVRITVQSLWAKDEPSSFVYEFAQSRIVIGRTRSADVQLPHPAVSATHASIRTQDAGYVLVDEGSTNGTRINETPVVAGRPKVLRNHDLIDLGGYRLTVDVGIPVAHTMSARLGAEYARQMLREQLDDPTDDALDAELRQIQSCADKSVELLPIAKEPPSEEPLSRRSAPDPDLGLKARARLGTSELLVYSLAALLIAASVVVMLLMRPQ